MGGIHRFDAFGVNQVGHRFGLIQIQFSVQKCPLGKLSRFSRLHTLFKKGFQYSLCNQHASVAGDLHRIFARVRFWRAEHRCQHFIHNSAVFFDDSPEVDGV
jgi:hypothetical protein